MTGSARSTKLHVSLPPDLYAFIRRRHEERGESISAAVAESIRNDMLAERQARLDEALALDAADDLTFARATAPTTARLADRWSSPE